MKKNEIKVTVTEGQEVNVEQKELGRPINLDSQRQKRMLELELKRQQGLLKKGRPSDPSSKRQQRLEELAEKRLNGTLKLGRPKMSEEEKAEAEVIKAAKREAEQKKIKEMAAQILAGKIEAPDELKGLIVAEKE